MLWFKAFLEEKNKSILTKKTFFHTHFSISLKKN